MDKPWSWWIMEGMSSTEQQEEHRESCKSVLENIINRAKWRYCNFYYPTAAVSFPNPPQSTSCWPSDSLVFAKDLVDLQSVSVFVYSTAGWLLSVTIHSFNKVLQRFKQKFVRRQQKARFSVVAKYLPFSSWNNNVEILNRRIHLPHSSSATSALFLCWCPDPKFKLRSFNLSSRRRSRDFSPALHISGALPPPVVVHRCLDGFLLNNLVSQIGHGVIHPMF